MTGHAPDCDPDDLTLDPDECTHCGGEGWQESDDPLWDEDDVIACKSCHGTGLGCRQWVW